MTIHAQSSPDTTDLTFIVLENTRHNQTYRIYWQVRNCPSVYQFVWSFGLGIKKMFFRESYRVSLKCLFSAITINKETIHRSTDDFEKFKAHIF